MSSSTLTLNQLNALDQDAFVARLGFVFERSPWVAEQTWLARPFASFDTLHAALCASVRAAPAERQLALICAHPDLAGKAAIANQLTRESASEQASAGLDRMSPDEYARFTALNTAYREQFGFPFIICVREHTKGSILASFETRLTHSRDAEIDTALDEIAQIARLRLLDIVAGP